VILVVSYPEDAHASRVIAALREAGRDVVLFDVSELPGRATLTFDYARPRSPRLTYGRDEGGDVDLRAASSVWWRRPQSAELSAIPDPDVRMFTANEWQEAINGLWQLLDARWVNDPVRDEVAARKALQLRVAAEEGLRVPSTLVTSDPDRARRFIETTGVGSTIFKTFSCTHQIWRETRLVTEADLDALDTVRAAPVIFQEYVPAEADLRITAVDGRLYAAAIRAGQTDYPVDFRMSLGQAPMDVFDLPADVGDRLRSLMRRLGLVYGAIDMRLTPDGEFVFLEVNTAGEFLFVEERTGLPITQALADCLAA